MGMTDRVLGLTVDGEQWSNIMKVMPLSLGDSIERLWKVTPLGRPASRRFDTWRRVQIFLGYE